MYSSKVAPSSRQSVLIFAQQVDLVVADAVVGEHHEREQLQRYRGAVFEVGGGVHGDTLVQVLETAVHHHSSSRTLDDGDGAVPTARSPSDRRRNSS